MAVDAQTIEARAATGGNDLVTLEYIPAGWSERMFFRASYRFPESRARIVFAAAVRNEEIVVPIPDPLLSDEDTDFVAYIAPERKSLEAGLRQQLESNPCVYERPPVTGSDTDDRNADLTETFANAMRNAIVPWTGIVGKSIEDGEFGITLAFDLDDFLAAPMPSDIKTEDQYKALPASEQADWTEIRLSHNRVTYRRYKTKYWRDADGKKPSDPAYRETGDDGARKQFERNDLATRRAWREHSKSWKAGKLPLTTRLISATDCAPLLVKGKGANRWECRGLAIRQYAEIDDLIAQGLRWTGLGTPEYPLAFDQSSGGRQVTRYEVWTYLETMDGEVHPCIVYQVDGRACWWGDGPDANVPAVVDLYEEYGLETLPANYFHGPHTESDDPDRYAYPAIYPLISSILNREGSITSYQAHLRKYSFSKRTVTPDPALDKAAWLNADNSPRDIDLSAEIVTLPGPMGTLVEPPSPDSLNHLITIYDKDIDTNAPSDVIRGAGNSTASGHSLSLQEGFFLSANRHILECARLCTQWIGEMALEMLCALEEKFGVKASVFTRTKPPADAQPAVKRNQAIEFNSQWLKGNYILNAVYPKVGNLAEIQQISELKQAGGATFSDLMEARGKPSVMNERLEIAADKFWDGPQGAQLLYLRALKAIGAMEDAAQLEQNIAQQAQPNGLPTAALPPELRALGPGGPPQGPPGMAPPGPGGPPGMPPGGGATPPMPGNPNITPDFGGPKPQMTLPNIARSSTAGIYSAALGGRSLIHDARAQSLANVPGGVPVPGGQPQ